MYQSYNHSGISGHRKIIHPSTTDKAKNLKCIIFTKQKIKLSTKTKSDQLEWRRSKVVELRARGLSQTEIARELQVSKASISLVMQHLS